MKKAILRLCLQLICCFIAAVIAYLLKPVRVIHFISAWILLPLLGAFTAFRLTVKGINPYLNWLLPAIGHTLGAYTVSAFLPGAGAVLLTAFVSLIGAACADTALKYSSSSRRHK